MLCVAQCVSYVVCGVMFDVLRVASFTLLGMCCALYVLLLGVRCMMCRVV